MPAEKILNTDVLRIGTGKINKAIDVVNKSEIDSAAALIAANNADVKSNLTQEQIDTLILENGTSDAEVLQARGGEPLLYNRLDKIDASLGETRSYPVLSSEVGVTNKKYPYGDIRRYGARSMLEVGYETFDSLFAIHNAIASYGTATAPPGVFGVSDTVKLGTRYKSLIGESEDILKGQSSTTIIKYIGSLDNRKTVVLLGTNVVGAEPTVDCSGVILKNIYIDANNLAGFGLYGTYLTNGTKVDNVVIKNSLEYNCYLAKGWYATIQNLTSLNCNGSGIALGMPLEYLDGTGVTWTSPSNLELNQLKIDNIRSQFAGEHFSQLNKNTYNPTNALLRRKGYGIGAGIGNGFTLTNFLSESSGGTGLYVYTSSQPRKNIQYGYLEANALNSGLLAASTKPQMIIENISSTGDSYEIRDIFVNYNSGGIYHTGVLGRKVWLKNVQQPRFLSSLDSLTAFQLYAEVLKQNVYFECGNYNTLDLIATGVDVTQTVDTAAASFTIPSKPSNGFKLIFIKGNGSAPVGSYTLNFEDGTSASRGFPAGLSTTYVLGTVAAGALVSITKSGVTGGTATNVTFKVMNTPITYI